MSSEMITGLIGFVAAFLLKEGWDLIRKNKDTTETEIRAALKENTAAIVELRVAFQRAEVELKHLLDRVSSIPEIEKDVNLIGAKLREMTSRADKKSEV